MALSGDTRPHVTTIANFVGSMGEKAVKVFTNMLTVCYVEGLHGPHVHGVSEKLRDVHGSGAGA